MRLGFASLSGLRGLGECFDDEGNDLGPGCDPASLTANAVPDCAFGGTWPNCVSPATLPNQSIMYNPGPGLVATNANSTAGLTALSQLTSAALSNIAKLPGQAALLPGQTLTMGPNGTYQIAAAGVSPGASLGLGSSTSLLPILLISGALFLFMGKR